MKGNNCIITCPIDHYENVITRICDACAANCSDCFGTLATECTVCHNGYSLNILNNSCNLICPDNFYGVGIVCEKCYFGCKTCTTAARNECDTCMADYYYLPLHRRCYTHVVENYYINTSSNIQIDCHIRCK